MSRWPPVSDGTWARIAAETHTFQNIRPPIPEANAQCPRCGLVLPNGPILSIGPGGLPPCQDVFDARPTR